MMTLKQFTRYASLHGADLDRWPANAAHAAQELLGHSDEARAILADAALTDALLDEASNPAVSLEREQRVFERIAARIEEQGVPDAVPWFIAKPPLRIVPTVGFLAMMGFLGFMTYHQGIITLPGAARAPDLSGVMIVSSLGGIR